MAGQYTSLYTQAFSGASTIVVAHNLGEVSRGVSPQIVKDLIFYISLCCLLQCRQ